MPIPAWSLQNSLIPVSINLSDPLVIPSASNSSQFQIFTTPSAESHIFIYFNYLLVLWLPSSSCIMGFGEQQFCIQLTDLLFPKLNYTHHSMVLAKLKSTNLLCLNSQGSSNIFRLVTRRFLCMFSALASRKSFLLVKQLFWLLLSLRSLLSKKLQPFMS